MRYWFHDGVRSQLSSRVLISRPKTAKTTLLTFFRPNADPLVRTQHDAHVAIHPVAKIGALS